jgi:lysophospholipase L1-like esterase
MELETKLRVVCIGDSITEGFGLGDDPSVYYPSLLQEFLGDEYEHNLETANELVALLSDTLSVTLPVVAQGDSTAKHEIVIGATAGYEDVAYNVSVAEGNLIITGGSDGAVYHAIDAIRTAFSTTTVAEVAWGEDFALSGKAPIRRIACIGDSLTEGSIGGHVTPELAHPAALGRLLWQDYVVYNYGLGGTTMMNVSKSPYQSSQQYADCLSSGLSYDLILVMLGTNDSKVIGDAWTDEANEAYMTACEELFAALAERSPEARFAFMNCPVKFTPAGYGNAYMIPVQAEAAEMLKDAGYDITHYDMRAYTTAVLTEANFRDGLHPDYAGYALIAEGVLDLVYHLTDGDENEYVIS